MVRIKRSPLAGFINTAFVASLLGFSAGASARSDLSYTVSGASAAEAKGLEAAATPGIYIVQLAEPALAVYRGEVAGLAVAGRQADGKLDVRSQAARDYVDYLHRQQDEFIGQASRAVGQSLAPVFRYEHALNGVALELTPSQAAKIAALSSVVRIERSVDQPLDTDRGPAFIGAPGVWNGTAPGVPLGSRGEGVVVGIIDSGINFDHPSFSATGGDSYTVLNPLGTGVFLGECIEAGTQVTCNDKLYGAYDFMTAVLPPSNAINGINAEDDNGHGSHTASTAAGNVVANADLQGTPVQISGVAPHANIIAYDACYTEVSTQRGLCPGAATLASVNQAIANQVDVINYSIGGGATPWNDAVSLAFLAANNAGIVVAASAGNSGPAASTLGHVEPWTITVAASSHDRIVSDATVTVVGPGTPGPALTDIAAINGTGPDPVGTLSGNLQTDANVFGCTAFPANTFNGIALLQRGGPGAGCGFAAKVANAAAAGATAVVIYSNRPGGPIVMGALETSTIPAVMISQLDGQAIAAFLASNPTATGEIELRPASVPVGVAGAGDVMANFSSRGPALIDVMKPNVSGPGLAILAAVSDNNTANGTPAEYGLLQGTSMSSPHVAGAAALLRAVRPTWTPSEVQSALATTGITAMVKEDGLTPATPFDRGAGRIDVSLAANAGLVMNETNANYNAADPGNGGDPRTLNVPGLMNGSCAFNCSWQRTFRNVTGASGTWNAALTLPVGVTGTVSPTSFTLAAGATQVVTVSLDVSAATPGTYLFGQADFTHTGTASAQKLPIAVRPLLADLPATVGMPTRRDAGSQLVPDLRTAAASQLELRSSGLVNGTRPTVSLSQDPTNGNPYDNLAQVFVLNQTIPAGTGQFVVEIDSDESTDLDLFVGTGTTPSAASQVCASATGAIAERCVLSAPAAGNYWVVIQNWAGSASQPDDISLWAAAVPQPTIAGTAGNLYATGPATVVAAQPFDIRVFWNDPAMAAGQRWYGAISLGSTPSNPGNLGTVPVQVNRAADDVVKTSDVPMTGAGATITYTVTVADNVTSEDLAYELADPIPAGVTYVDGSASSTVGSVDDAGGTVEWTLTQPGTSSPPGAAAVLTYQVEVEESAVGSTVTNTVTHTTDNPGSQSATSSASVEIVGVEVFGDGFESP